MDRLTDKELKALRRARKNVSPGVWTKGLTRTEEIVSIGETGIINPIARAPEGPEGDNWEDDSDFILKAWDCIPALLNEIDRLNAQRDKDMALVEETLNEVRTVRFLTNDLIKRHNEGLERLRKMESLRELTKDFFTSCNDAEAGKFYDEVRKALAAMEEAEIGRG